MMRASGSRSLAVWMGGIALMLAVIAAGAWFAGILPRQTVALLPPSPENRPEPKSAEAASRPLDADDGAGQDDTAGGEPAAGADTDTVGADPSRTNPAAAGADGPIPRLDEVRHEADGLVVIAGRAAPFADVILRLDGFEFAHTTADGSGAFATVATLGPSERARVLTLAQLGASGREVTSPDELILAPVRAAAEADEPVVQDDDNSFSTGAGVETAALQPSDPAFGTTDSAILTDGDGLSADTATDRVSSGSATGPAEDTAGVEQAAASNETAARSAPDPQDAASDPTGIANAAPGDAATVTDTASDDPAQADPAQAETTVARGDGTEPRDTAVAPDVTAAAPGQVATAEIRGAGSPEQHPLVEPAARPVTAPSAATELPAAPDPDSGQRIAILRSNEAGVSVVRPADPQPEAMRQVALDSISYSDSGDVELQGRAQNVAREVRVYLDNRPVASLEVSESGNWRGALPEVDTGVYTLRIDEVDAEGRVTSRVETPFKRESPEVLVAATEDIAASVSAVTVQRGDTLWAISRERYGEGILYVRVFEANRDSIRDPDLIYPGQIFTLPAD